MKLVNGSDAECPYCGKGVDVEVTWECDGPPYPDQQCDCPHCGRSVHVWQSVKTELSK